MARAQFEMRPECQSLCAHKAPPEHCSERQFQENGSENLGPSTGFALMILRQEMMILGQMQLLEVGFGYYSACKPHSVRVSTYFGGAISDLDFLINILTRSITQMQAMNETSSFQQLRSGFLSER